MSLVKYQKSVYQVARNESPVLKNSKRDDFCDVIAYVCKTIGIKPDNVPKGIILDSLHSFMSENLGSYTLKEVVLAFEKYASLKLSFQDDHYQDLSPVFFSKVMRAYTSFLFSNNVVLSNDNESAKGEDIKKALIEKGHNSFIDFIINDIQKQDYSLLSVNPLYNILLFSGHIKTSKSDKIQMYGSIKRDYILNIKPIKSKAIKEDFKKFINQKGFESGYHNDKVIQLLKIKLYKNFVSTNKNTNLDLLKKSINKNLNEYIKRTGKSIFE